MGMTKRIFVHSSEEEHPLDKIRRLEKENFEKEKKINAVLNFLQRMKDEANEYPTTN